MSVEQKDIDEIITLKSRLRRYYGCRVVRVIDGDTIDIDIDMGFDFALNNARVRLYGYDTPETRTRDKVEKQLGLAVKAKVEEMFPPGAEVVLVSQSYERGKYGRILGDIETVDGRSWREYLISMAAAVKEGYTDAYKTRTWHQLAAEWDLIS